jgi:hypothetical protein
MSVEPYHEFQKVSQLLLDTPLTADAIDQRSFVWGDK